MMIVRKNMQTKSRMKMKIKKHLNISVPMFLFSAITLRILFSCHFFAAYNDMFPKCIKLTVRPEVQN
jgi:hypothetical protein